MKTETELPVDTGTTITVSCKEGYINTGSEIVTCNTFLYQDLSYDTKPSCNSLRKYSCSNCNSIMLKSNIQKLKFKVVVSDCSIKYLGMLD